MPRVIALAATVGLMLFGWDSVGAVPVQGFPTGVGLNVTTNRIYVASNRSSTVSVIDGETERIIATLPVGFLLELVAVNPVTNRIYVTDEDGDLSVIDGSTDTVIATIPIGLCCALGVDVNPVTNRVYVADDYAGRVVVIDGATNTKIDRIRVGLTAYAVAVNPATNLIYVVNFDEDSVSVIRGTTNRVIATIPVGDGPIRVAVNPATNRIYVTNYWGGNVSVIRGNIGPVIATIPLGAQPLGVAVNPATNRIYVANGGNVSVIRGATNKVIATLPVGLGLREVAVNSATNRIYASNSDSGNVSVLYGDELLKNSSFDSGGLEPEWRAKDLDGNDGLDPVLANIFEGRFSMRLTGVAGVHKALVQRVHAAGPAGSILNVVGVSKAQDASPTGGDYKIRLQVGYTDDTAESFEIHFPKSTHNWRRSAASFTAAKDFTRLTVNVMYENQTGTAWFDAVHVWRSP